MALGEVDYGLLGVVGGLITLIAFFNTILSVSIARYYAFSVGTSRRKGFAENGLSECQRWFSVAVSIHTLLPSILIMCGYPIGVWAIENYLRIPTDRIADCIWVFRCVCLACYFSMITLPFQAMYTAKQYIAELSIYAFCSTSLNAIFLYYMVSHPGRWLVPIAFWNAVLAVVPSLIISIRACYIFPECKILRKHLFNISDIKELLGFAGWNFFGMLGNLAKNTGTIVLVNKMLGPRFNASMSIANTVATQTQTLSSAILGAFMPAITEAHGANDRPRMVSLVHKTCKFGAVLILPFAIPLAIEIDEVMRLWLGSPPPHAGSLCVWFMTVLVFDNMTSGHWTVVAANGKVAWYQFLVGITLCMTLPIAWMLMRNGFGVCSVGYALMATLTIAICIRIIAVKILVGISHHYWIRQIFLPIVCAGIVSTLIGFVPRLIMTASLVRVCITSVLVETILLPLIFFVVFDLSERMYFYEKFHWFLSRTKGAENA